MMNKFWYLVKYGFKKKMKSKSFIISNKLIFVILLVITNIDSIISFFGGDFDEKTKIYVLDNTNDSYDSFKLNYDNVEKSLAEDIGNTAISKSEKTLDELYKDIDIQKM